MAETKERAWREGDAVLCKYQDTNEFFPARIIHHNADGTYDVEFEGEQHQGVLAQGVGDDALKARDQKNVITPEERRVGQALARV